MNKFLLKLSNSLPLLLLCYALSLVLSTVLFSLVEGYTLFESFWWSCVTSLTIGYGDISPVTMLGQCLGIILGHFWVFIIIPCVIANIVTKIIVNHDAFTHDEQECMKKDLAEINMLLKRYSEKKKNG
jgi:voltage-gated potassium channel